MKKRNILFGYQYQDGIIVTCPREVTVLKRIFGDYLKGLSLLDIANQLNVENVEYQPGVTGWNKSRIMRLIEDDRYVGMGAFPAVIDMETHQALCQMKTEKNTQAGTDRSAKIFHIDVPVICPVCGHEMNRRHDSRFKKCQQRWICSNADCRTVIHKPDDVLLDDITVLLNTVIVNPELVQVSAEPEHEPSVQVRKIENEIARTLDTLDYDKDTLRQKMLECVSLKYADIDSASYTAHRLKATLANTEPLSAFSMPLFKRAVQSIHLDKNGTVAITLINNQTIRKGEEYAADNDYSAESGSQNSCQSRYC
jgi:hypothetical protein